MNARTKAQLRGILADLEVMFEGEVKATKRHNKTGDDKYATHAAWCSEGIEEAIMLLQNKFPAEAINLLKLIVASSPTDDLQPHKKTAKKSAATGSPCDDGNCNHPEHM